MDALSLMKIIQRLEKMTTSRKINLNYWLKLRNTILQLKYQLTKIIKK